MILKTAKLIQTYLAPMVNLDIFYSQKNVEVSQLPTLYILGLPRSGSTLLFQMMNVKYHLNYFSNLSNVFYKSPVFLSILLTKFGKQTTSQNYQSNYGTTPGLQAPSEAGKIIRHYFNSQKGVHLFFQKVNAIKNKNSKPFLIKNLNLAYHINTLQANENNVKFIYIERDLRYVTQSVFLKNKKARGIGFIGIKKKDYDIQNLEELALKVKSINETLKNQLVKQNAIFVHYEQLCQNPKQVFEQIEEQLKELIPFKKIQTTIDTQQITENKKIQLNAKQWNLLTEIFKDEK